MSNINNINNKNIYVGISGFSYESFYPKNINHDNYLKFYSNYFNCVEINNTFYKFPDKNIIKRWYSETNKDFKFIIKVNKYFTHNKKLNIDNDFKKLFIDFYKSCLYLKDKLSFFLFQLPSIFKFNEKNYNKLDNLGKFIKKFKINCVFEFRDNSMFNEKIYKLFEKYNFNLAISDYFIDVKIPILTENIYFRFNGNDDMYQGSYTNILNKLKKFINKNSKSNNIFVIFNNTDSYSKYDNREIPDAYLNGLNLIKLLK